MTDHEIAQVDRIIRKDTEFLASLNIMDYSLLLGIESRLQISSEWSEHTVVNAGRALSQQSTAELERFKRHRFTSADCMQTYHVSIIDFLQLWNCKKRAEQLAKVTIMRADKKKLSAVEPEFYKERFQRFMRRQVFVRTFQASQRSSSRVTSLNQSILRHQPRLSQLSSLNNSSVQSQLAGPASGHQSAPILSIVEEGDPDNHFFDSQFDKFQQSSNSLLLGDGQAKFDLKSSLVEEHDFFNGVTIRPADN